ncbi:hypothetical protein DL240_10220 [Lujinxingia litoralis]|uniref:Dickkopf N-terminal cysteine-rich domain-containing protein n=2 Tax=Lujinxingia litoralis TaxID=2211119 RepID=A0A328C4N5_9DELT|nr:hypothetical protein DL240_10220 [Lujinxingia litoralis]
MALMVSLTFLSSCGNFGGDIVGGECRDDIDCDPGSTCKRGDDYPYGMCVRACDRHEDCPMNTACVDRSGGICLPTCMDRYDCREGYVCDDQRNRSGGGRSYVCMGD